MECIEKELLNFRHIFRLTDDTGMFQHSKYGVPDPSKGYTTDDNARALIAAVMIYEKYKQSEYLDLIYRYASFLLNAQNEVGKFKNFMDYNRNFVEEEGSEDCFGRCLWALGYTVAAPTVPQNVKAACKSMLKKALPNVEHLKFIRGKAYSIIGLSYMDGNDIRQYIETLASSLVEEYHKHSEDQWNWFEESVTYCNAVMPWALFKAYRVLGEQQLLDIAIKSMKFLEKETFTESYFQPIGCKGWLEKNKKAALFDQQPVEACEMLLAFLEAYKITHDFHYLKRARACFEWYQGRNCQGLCLIDPETGGCYDGITKEGLNYNQGAESLVSYYIAYMTILNHHGLFAS